MVSDRRYTGIAVGGVESIDRNVTYILLLIAFLLFFFLTILGISAMHTVTTEEIRRPPAAESPRNPLEETEIGLRPQTTRSQATR